MLKRVLQLRGALKCSLATLLLIVRQRLKLASLGDPVLFGALPDHLFLHDTSKGRVAKAFVFTVSVHLDVCARLPKVYLLGFGQRRE